MHNNIYHISTPEYNSAKEELSPNQRIKSIESSIIGMRERYLIEQGARRYSGPLFWYKSFQSKDDLVNREAEVGGSLFSESLPDAKVLFFFHEGDKSASIGNENSWILNINRIDNWGRLQSETTRFITSPKGNSKVIDSGKRFVPMTQEEDDNLNNAAEMYLHKTSDEIYRSLKAA